MSSGLTMSQMNRTSSTGSQGCSPVTANCGISGAASASGSGSGAAAPHPAAIVVTNPSAASFAAVMTPSSRNEMATEYHRALAVADGPPGTQLSRVSRVTSR